MSVVQIYAKKDIYNIPIRPVRRGRHLATDAAGRRPPHGLKYRLYCGRKGECIVRYDNETAKGDHVHYGNTEQPYRFTSLGHLVQDFYADIERLTGERP